MSYRDVCDWELIATALPSPWNRNLKIRNKNGMKLTQTIQQDAGKFFVLLLAVNDLTSSKCKSKQVPHSKFHDPF